MKKVLALVLAGVMTASMSVMAFAVDGAEAKFEFGDLLNSDGVKTTIAASDPGATFYIPVLEKVAEGEPKVVTDTKDITAKYLLDVDNDSDKSLGVATRLVEEKLDEYNNGKKAVFFKVTTKDNFERDPQTLKMTITYKSKDKAKQKTDYFTTDALDGDLSYNEDTISGSGSVENGWNEFDSDDEITLFFGDENEVEFKIDVKGQKELFLRYNDDEDEAIADKYADADITYHYFEGSKDTFKREGTLRLPADEDSFVYEIVDGKLVAVETKYDDVDEVATFKTKTLGNYIVSDTELVAADAEGEGTDAETNPDTGANDFVGLAVALAVVSVAGIAVAKRK